jgi:hypothetical protein
MYSTLLQFELHPTIYESVLFLPLLVVPSYRPPLPIFTVAGRAQITSNSVLGSGASSDVEQRAPLTL